MSNIPQDPFSAAGKPPEPPELEAVVTTTLAGRQEDPFYQLRDLEDPRTRKYLDDEIQYSNIVLENLRQPANQIAAEIRRRVPEPDESFPLKRGSYSYVTRIEPHLDYPVMVRRQPGVPEQLVVDENRLAGNSRYFAMSGVAVADNETTIAFGIDRDGSERYTLTVAEIGTSGPIEHERIFPTTYGFVFSNDSQHLFYTVPDETMRPASVMRHRVGTDPATDVCIFAEADARYFLDVGRTKDRRFLTLTAESKRTSECWLIDGEAPEGDPWCFARRIEGLQYQLDHGDDGFVIMANPGGGDFSLFTAADAGASWKPLPILSEAEILEAFELFGAGMALQTRISGVPKVSWMRRGEERIALGNPDSAEGEYLAGNLEYASAEITYEVTSLSVPARVYGYSIPSGSRTLLWQQRVGEPFDSDDYESQRTFGTAADGTAIPISIVKRKDLPLPAPTLVYAYGAYEEPVDPAFSISRLSLLDRGFAFAVAHVRGGGEFGRRWYDQGRQLSKLNSITDLLACVDRLEEMRLADPGKIALRGASAGGLTVGAAMNASPTRFSAAVLEVPFVDCLTTMLDPSLPLTITEWEEWGNPAESEEVAKLIASYAPYNNLKRGVAYPDLFLTTGLNDSRVGFWEPLKLLAKLRSIEPRARALLKVQDEGGHLGPTKRVEEWEEEAQLIAFLVSTAAR